MAVIFISLGSNIDRQQHINAGLSALKAAFDELAISRVYESESVGFEGSDFDNLVARAQTDMSIEAVIQHLKKIEDVNGRIRGDKKFAPRTLDLDLLLYDNVVCQQPVELPRGEILHNAFVLWPLSELAGDLLHPAVKLSYETLWAQFDKSSQQLWPVNFVWEDALL